MIRPWTLLALALVCAPSGAAPFTPSELTGAMPIAMPRDFSAFAPATQPVQTRNRFEGRLILAPEPDSAGVKVYRDDFGEMKDARGTARRLPAFDFTFAQSGDALIPARRGTIAGSHPEWEIILEPGRVWDQADDGDYSRASIPFTLEERNANCMHNGVLTFLFKSDGSVSKAAYQIASETCLYSKFDLWGRVAARYVPGTLPDRSRLIDDYAAEIAHRTPVKPIAALATDYGLDPTRFGAEIAAADMTTYGVVVKGRLYSGGCGTRLGAYPFCAELDLPSYSLAKSIFGGLASMRLALLYPGVMQESVAGHVPACAAWTNVSFGDALNMATGHYNSPADQADEGAPDILPFFLDETHAGRIAFACTHYPAKSPPGTLWVYHTTDAYILGTVLRDFFQSHTAPGSDIYRDVLVDPVWHRLHLDPAIDVTRRSYDAVAQPFTGWGLTLHRDDIAKLAGFLTTQHGKINEERVIDQAMLDAALQHNSADRGLPAAFPSLRYKNGFWAWNAADAIGCKEPTWIPFMSGFGGIIVALLPNGVTYFYVSDGGTYAWAQAVREAAKIAPVCSEARHGN